MDKLQANMNSFLVEAAASPIEKLEQRRSGNSWVSAQIWLSTWHWAFHLALSFAFALFTSYELLFAYLLRVSVSGEEEDGHDVDVEFEGWILNILFAIGLISAVVMLLNALKAIVGVTVAFYAYVLKFIVIIMTMRLK